MLTLSDGLRVAAAVPSPLDLNYRGAGRAKVRVGATVVLAVVAILGVAFGPSVLMSSGGTVPPGQVAPDPTPISTEAEPSATPTAAAAFVPAAPIPEWACGASGSGWPEGSDVADYEAYEGLTFEQAQDLAARSGVVLRVLGQDGICVEGPFTADLRGYRVNLYLDSGRVVSAYAG